MEQYITYILGGKSNHVCENEEYKTVYKVESGKIEDNGKQTFYKCSNACI